MNCNCISTVEKNVADYMKPKAGEDAKATCMATGFALDNDGMRLILNIPFRVKGSKKGFTTEKGKELPVAASFCPFCGVSTKKPKDDATGEPK